MEDAPYQDRPPYSLVRHKLIPRQGPKHLSCWPELSEGAKVGEYYGIVALDSEKTCLVDVMKGEVS